MRLLLAAQVVDFVPRLPPEQETRIDANLRAPGMSRTRYLRLPPEC